HGKRVDDVLVAFVPGCAEETVQDVNNMSLKAETMPEIEAKLDSRGIMCGSRNGKYSRCLGLEVFGLDWIRGVESLLANLSKQEIENKLLLLFANGRHCT